MLLSLCVKDFAIIEDLTVNFNEGMTVLTGETGAGKSLIIDTISLLLGSRADSDMIRYGKKEARVLGKFSNNPKLSEVFKSLGIKESSDIEIERIISDSSKNTVKINGTLVTLNNLKQIAKYLADIHVQNDTFKLFNPDIYLEMLDSLGDNNFNKYMSKYSKSLLEYLDTYKDYEKILKGIKNLEEKLDFLKYEKEELEALELYPNMDKELEEKIAKLSNFDKISQSLSEAYNMLDGNTLDMLYEASKSLERVSSYDKEYEEYSSKLLDSYYISDEIKGNIRKAIDSLDYDEDELNISIEKMNDLSKVMDKYKKNVDELISYLKEITLSIDMAENYDETLKEHKELVIKAYEKLKKDSIELTNYRKKIAKELASGIVLECMDLDLLNTKFEVLFNDIEYKDPFDKSIFKEDGVDSIDFLISFNKGEPLKPLYKVASGGEASRIMLAFKTFFSNKSNVSLMVFDEIDTGVSGQTASKIADKMHKISENIQVLCITHLPQVASSGDYHKHIYKIEENGRTKTEIKDLSKEERIEEVALMLSGDSLSLYALNHARELIEKNNG